MAAFFQLCSVKRLPVSGTVPDSHVQDRQYFLDWLRISAFVLLVFYHAGMYYVTWAFHVKSPYSGVVGPALEPWMKLSEPWRMGLLFIISGAVTSLMLQSRSTHAATASSGGDVSLQWLRRRSRRLLLPLLFGMAVVIPPQSYYQVVQQYGFQGGFWEFLPLYYSHFKGFCHAAAGAPSQGCLILPTWNHLWFLPYVWIYTVLLWALLKLWPNFLNAGGAWIERRWSKAGLMLIPVVYLTAIRWWLHDRFHSQGSMFPDWYYHLLFLSMFLMGAAFMRAPRLWEALSELRWIAFLLALTSGAWYASGHGKYLTVACLQWGAIVAAIGFSHRRWNVDHPWRNYLNQGVFPLYILHQTCIIVLAQWLAPLGLAPAAEAASIIVGTFGICWLGYECVRRLPWLQVWMGVNPQSAVQFMAVPIARRRSRPPSP